MNNCHTCQDARAFIINRFSEARETISLLKNQLYIIKKSKYILFLADQQYAACTRMFSREALRYSPRTTMIIFLI